MNKNEFEIEDGVLISYKGNDEEVTIPNDVSRIELSAFENATNLKTLVVPSSVEYVNECYYSNNNYQINAEKIIFGCNDYDQLSSCVFVLTKAGVCPNLKTIVFDKNNTEFKVIDNVIYSFNEDTIYKALFNVKNIKVSDKTKKICRYAFESCKDLETITLPNGLEEIESSSFLLCNKLKELYIPNTVKNIGYHAFYGLSSIKKIKISLPFEPTYVDPKAFVFINDECDWKEFPISFLENDLKYDLAINFIENSDDYNDEYKKIYQTVANRCKKKIMEIAKRQKKEKVIEYYEGKKETKNINIKKLSSLAKVQLLEEKILKNDFNGVKETYENVDSFEFTARALGYACRYASAEIVEYLLSKKINFKYKYSDVFARKYNCGISTYSSTYHVDYSLLSILHTYEGIGLYWTNTHQNLVDNEVKPLSEEDRNKNIVLLIKYLNKKDLGRLLYFSILLVNKKITETLIKAGVELDNYYIKVLSEVSGYSNEYTSFVNERATLKSALISLKTDDLKWVINTFDELLKPLDKKIIFTDNMFSDSVGKLLNVDVIKLLQEKVDLSKVNKTNVLKTSILCSNIETLSYLMNDGWIASSTKRNELLEYAKKEKNKEAVASIMDYIDKNVDLVKENNNKEKHEMAKLNADLNSATYLKTIWSSRKNKDGTLCLTNYKGNETEVVVPEYIGKTKVTSLNNTFNASEYNNVSNIETRKNITKIVLPDSISEIDDSSFKECTKLKEINMPKSLKKIGTMAFFATGIESINIPKTVKKIGYRAFVKCKELNDVTGGEGINTVEYNVFEDSKWYEKQDDGIIYLGTFALYIKGKPTKELTFKDGTKHIAVDISNNNGLSEVEKIEISGSIKSVCGISGCYKLKKLILHEGIEELESRSFADCKVLEKVELPSTIKDLGWECFANSGLTELAIPNGIEYLPQGFAANCHKLKDVYIPDSVIEICDVYEPAFENCENVVIHGTKDSEAIKFANKLSLKYVIEE